jgi:4-hydroxythreonine-4-phosphate dehydrogenase
MGDPAGIGGEIALMAWRNKRNLLAPFYLLDDPDRLARLSAAVQLECPIKEILDPSETSAVFDTALPVLRLSKSVNAIPGDDSTADGEMVIEAIDRAIEAAISGAVCGMVTNPIQKSRLYDAGFTAPGHTEYLGERVGLTRPPIMLLAGPNLKVVPVTIHLSLVDAIAALTKEEIVRTLKVAINALQHDFGIEKPRIAVSGLNPHAGESGHMGREEIEIIGPAIAEIHDCGAVISGPLAADTMFHHAARTQYDLAVCMYHDQALVPMKTLDFDNGVNISAGLPFVRTSPDHGTAYNIAGTGTANSASLVSAIRMASEIATCRARPHGDVAVA